MDKEIECLHKNNTCELVGNVNSKKALDVNGFILWSLMIVVKLG